MKLDKLVKQAKRDLMASPKKAALLGLMLLVAAYFWGPLLWKWVAPSGSASAKGSQTALILTDDPVLPDAAKAKGGKAKAFRWEKVRQLISGDRLMIPAAYDAKWANPFALPASEAPAQSKQPQDDAGQTPVEALLAGISPAQAGLKLQSVAIGIRSRTATISGETYREGEPVQVVGKDASGTLLEFRVVRIERDAVEVQRGGKSWRLEFEKTKLAQGDEIERSGE